MQWSFSNKVSALPQFLSFKAAQEDRSRKTVQDPLASSTYMTISPADAFGTSQKPFSSAIQVFFSYFLFKVWQIIYLLLL